MHSNTICLCTMTSLFLFLLFSLCFFHLFPQFTSFELNSSNSSVMGCVQSERKALLEFKKGIHHDPSGRLNSWDGDDHHCCHWLGVGCSNHTGHVIRLDLKNQCITDSLFATFGYRFSSEEEAACDRLAIGGNIASSLVHLKYLEYLDLSLNNFEYIPIPNFIGSLNNLKYLNLSFANFSGMIPPHLGNLSNLNSLDLNSFWNYENSWVYDMNWIYGLRSLEYLNLGRTNLSLASSHWLEAVNKLPSLLELHLPNCGLTDLPQSLPSLNLTSLLVLNLNGNYFNSLMPGWLSNITTLVNLDISYSQIQGTISNMNWIYGLRSLEYLNLGGTNLSLASSHWLEAVNKLPSLLELHLPDCWLTDLPQSLPSLNLTSLLVLNLYHNNFNSLMPGWLSNITTLVNLDLSDSQIQGTISNIEWRNLGNLEVLDLSSNKLNGEIAESVGCLENLRSLRLPYNSISGSIPASIGRLSLLEELDLMENAMNGTIPESMGKLEQLVHLILDGNSWEGVVTEVHFHSLFNLKYLTLSSSNKSFAFYLGNEWIPPFSLQSISVKNCKMNPTFPAWLSTQKELYYIVFQNVPLIGNIPHWFWKLTPNLQSLLFSHTQLSGNLPKTMTFSLNAYVDLSYNLFDGPLSLFYNVTRLDLSYNSFYGKIPFDIHSKMSQLESLDLSGNFFNGNIHSSISRLVNLTYLVLSKNNFTGNLNMNWNYLRKLNYLDLSKNNLSGGISHTLCLIPNLWILKLNDNKFFGDMSALENCTSLYTLDLGHNRFFGTIPNWIGGIRSLSILSLRFNMFIGTIPTQLCGLSNLHIMDLARNNLFGSIPPCLANLSSLSSDFPLYNSSSLKENMDLNVKGRIMEYIGILWLVNMIDLSSNNFGGEIPQGIANLSALGTLNLSRNNLTGKIPMNIGELKKLETLDLSYNHLSGSIPSSMSAMTFLDYLNLSYNHLSGAIPTTNQFQTFNDPFIYEGNPELCGPPLSRNCTTSHHEGDVKSKNEEDDDEFEMLWFYIGMSFGFEVGFWAVCGSLLVKKSWRRAYFSLVDEVKDYLFVFVTVNIARLRRKMKCNK